MQINLKKTRQFNIPSSSANRLNTKELLLVGRVMALISRKNKEQTSHDL